MSKSRFTEVQLISILGEADRTSAADQSDSSKRVICPCLNRLSELRGVFIAVIATAFLTLPAAAQEKYTVNGDGTPVLIKAPTCKNAQYTQLEEWGGDFYNAWCLDREQLTRAFDKNGGVALSSIYEKVVDKVVFWRGVDKERCTSGRRTLIELFNQLHGFYGKRPELLYRDLDEGIREFLATNENSCGGPNKPRTTQISPDSRGGQVTVAKVAEDANTVKSTSEDGGLLHEAVRSAIADSDGPAPPRPSFTSVEERLAYLRWQGSASKRLQQYIPEAARRLEFLNTVWYESSRVGLEPALVLGLIEASSSFKKYAISPSGARGYMQVLPLWAELIGDGDASRLFHVQTNLRFGCVILRHYLEKERGDLYLALGRYHGTRGQPEFPNKVLEARRGWLSIAQ